MSVSPSLNLNSSTQQLSLLMMRRNGDANAMTDRAETLFFLAALLAPTPGKIHAPPPPGQLGVAMGGSSTTSLYQPTAAPPLPVVVHLAEKKAPPTTHDRDRDRR